MENTLGGSAMVETEPLLPDEMGKKLAVRARKIAEKLAEAKAGRRFVLVRFHHDADGIAGALALSSVLKFSAWQQNSAVYSMRDAVRDLGTLAYEQSPIVLLVDFGMNKQSEEGLRLLKASGAWVAIIDHHPPSGDAAKIADMGITPWEFSQDKDCSKYTAGYLACEIAVACGIERQKAMGLAKIACAGDKSHIFITGAEDREKALVLDFLAAHASFGNSLDFYRKVMASEELFRSIVQQAKDSIEEAAQKAMEGMKKTKRMSETVKNESVKEQEIVIVTFSLERIARIGEWPPSSKITTHVYEKLVAGASEQGGEPKPLFCVGYTDRSLILRLNDAAVAIGLSANELAEQLKKTMPDFVEGGGGHAKAGAIRVRTGFVKEVLGELSRMASAIAQRKNY